MAIESRLDPPLPGCLLGRVSRAVGGHLGLLDGAHWMLWLSPEIASHLLRCIPVKYVRLEVAQTSRQKEQRSEKYLNIGYSPFE